MITLKKNFKRKGIEFTQLFKSTELVVYQLERDCYNGTHTSWFEVLKYRIHQPDKYHDDEYEMYGSDEECGTYFWSCSDTKCVQKVLEREFPDADHAEILQICSGVKPN